MNKVSVCYLVLFLFSAAGINGAAELLIVDKNPYGDPVIKVPSINKDEKDLLKRATRLEEIKNELLTEIAKQERSFFVDLPLAVAGLSAELVANQGFSIYHTNTQRMELLKIVNGISIPPVITGNNAAKILITRTVGNKLQVLFTQEKGRKGASLPGGTLEYGEDACNGVLRELHEELSLRIGLEKLMFLGVLNRVKAFGYDVTHNEFLFHLRYDGMQKIVPDGKEVTGIVWEFIDDVVKSGKVQGASVLQPHLLVIKGLARGKQGKPCVRMPDYRQLKEWKKDPSDIMMFLPAE